MTKPRSYIGLTGPTRFLSVVNAVDKTLIAALLRTDRQIMIGGLASSRTLRGKKTRHPKRYPEIMDLPDVFIESPHLLNLVHFDTTERLFAWDVVRISRLCGPRLHGFQLNIPWPNILEIKKLVTFDIAQKTLARSVGAPRRERMRLVIQIGREAYAQVGNDPLELVRRLEPYRNVMTDILFDPSGGTGQEFVLETAQSVLRVLYPAFGLTKNIVVAGGLKPGTVGRLAALLAEFPDLSWDIESGVRDEDDAFVTAEAKLYLLNSLTLCLP